MNDAIRSQMDRWQKTGLIVGAAGLAACGLGAFIDTHRFFVSYLFGYHFWLGLALGCFGVSMIHHLTGGRWGFVSRRFLEAGYGTLPFMAVLFLPLLFGLRELYPWAQPATVATSEVLKHKQVYMNVPAFVGRAIVFFAIWIGMTSYLRKWSLAQDKTNDPGPTVRMRTLSGPGVVIYAVSGTFAYIDWVMSLESGWYSTMFPVIVLIGQILSTFAFLILLLSRFEKQEPFSRVVTAKHFHDLGNLLLAFVIFYTYISFSQLLIIYSGNMPRETEWYLHRIAGGWKWIVGLLAIFHFFVPFFLLLLRTTKRHAERLKVIGAIIFCVHSLAIYWVIVPTFYPDGLHVSWLDFAAWLGVGGIWFSRFAAGMKQYALLPQNDPRIEYAVGAMAHAK